MRLRFENDADEAEYQVQLAASMQRRFVVAAVLALVITAGMYFIDPIVVSPRGLHAMRTGRYAMTPAPFAAMVALGFASPRRFARCWQWVGGAAILCTLGGIAAIHAALHFEAGALSDRSVLYGLLALAIAVLAFHSLYGLGTVFATAATGIGSAVYSVTYVVVGDVLDLAGFVIFWVVGANAIAGYTSYSLERARRRDFQLRREIEYERHRSEELLLNVLPEKIAARLKATPGLIADGHADVSILFADIVGFTDLAARLPPAEVVQMLNRLFTEFDDLAAKYHLEKIKTIGDAYMVVGGVPEPRADHAEAVADMALAMRDVVAVCARETGHPLKVRIGIHCGPVVAGVIGKRKFAYDLWGDAVNTASRMESHGIAGEIQVTEEMRGKLASAFVLRERGVIAVKGKGEVAAHLLERRSH